MHRPIIQNILLSVSFVFLTLITGLYFLVGNTRISLFHTTIL